MPKHPAQDRLNRFLINLKKNCKREEMRNQTTSTASSISGISNSSSWSNNSENVSQNRNVPSLSGVNSSSNRSSEKTSSLDSSCTHSRNKKRILGETRRHTLPAFRRYSLPSTVSRRFSMPEKKIEVPEPLRQRLPNTVQKQLHETTKKKSTTTSSTGDQIPKAAKFSCLSRFSGHTTTLPTQTRDDDLSANPTAVKRRPLKIPQKRSHDDENDVANSTPRSRPSSDAAVDEERAFSAISSTEVYTRSPKMRCLYNSSGSLRTSLRQNQKQKRQTANPTKRKYVTTGATTIEQLCSIPSTDVPAPSNVKIEDCIVSPLLHRTFTPGMKILDVAWQQPKALSDAAKSPYPVTPLYTKNMAEHRMVAKRAALEQIRRKLESNQYEADQDMTFNEDQSIDEPISHIALTTTIASIDSNAAMPATVAAPNDVEAMDWESEYSNPSSDEGGSFDNDATCAEPSFPWHNNVDVNVGAYTDKLPNWKIDRLYFVLDTNILIHYLGFVKNLTRIALCGTTGSILFIPYKVISELDNLKNFNQSRVTRSNACHAIRYLNEAFDKTHDIQAQSGVAEKKHSIEVISPDDSIINCCLQLKSVVPKMLLLTEDGNMRLKAKANDIPVTTKSNLIAKYPKQFAALRSS